MITLANVIFEKLDTSEKTMLNRIATHIKKHFCAPEVSAHCDGPCGVYDSASARIYAEAVVSMTKKILDLNPSVGDHATANILFRYIAIKEEQAQKTKEELLILWTDYFKPVHLEKYPDLHDTFWKAAKLCSACKVEVSLDQATELLATVEKIHTMFWSTKNRNVAWIRAS
jgi:nickel superoxide dismutase